jgi:hypothetical protein
MENQTAIQIEAQRNALRNALRNVYKIRETKNTYIFSNKLNMWVELRKTNGSYVDGNMYDNESTQVIFRALFDMATSN